MIPKFRAWDKHRNEMNYRVMVGNCDTNDENWTCPIIWIEERQDWLHFDDYDSIMQSTGLIDKNGREIFEGDILCDEGLEEEYGYVYVTVSYKDGMWVCDEITSDGCGYGGALNEFSDDYSIIGNIYENQGLIEEILKEK